MRRELIIAVAGLAFAIGTAGIPVQGSGVFETPQALAWNPVKAAKNAASKVGGAVKKGAKAVGGAAATVGKGAAKGVKKVGGTAARGAGKVVRGAGKVAKGAAIVGCRVSRPTARTGACKDAVNAAIRAGKRVGRGAAGLAKRAGRGAAGLAKRAGRGAAGAAKKAAFGAAQRVGRAVHAGRKIGEAILDDRVRVGIPDLSHRGVRRPGTRDHRRAGSRRVRDHRRTRDHRRVRDHRR